MANAEPGESSSNSLTLPFLATLGALLLYQGLRLLPIPGVDLSAFLETGLQVRHISIVALGISPFLVGFFLAEVFSFLLPWGRRQRRNGVGGRKKLNVLAVRLSFVVAAYSAMGIASYLMRATSIAGDPMVADPGLGFRVIASLTLMVGVALCYLLASFISRWGLGNGFSVLFVYGLLAVAFHFARDLPSVEMLQHASSLEIFAVLLVVGYLIHRFLRRNHLSLHGEQGEEVGFMLPAFQQSILPLTLTSILVSQVWAWTTGQQPQAVNGPLSLVVATVLLALLSLAGFHAFSSRKRLESALPSRALPMSGALSGRRFLEASILVLIVISVGFEFGQRYWKFWITEYLFLRDTSVFFLTALATDLYQEWRFRSRNGNAAGQLVELDNVHLASYLQGLLRAHDIDALARAYHFRSLLFLFGPLMKIELMVPVGELERARELARPEEVVNV